MGHLARDLCGTYRTCKESPRHQKLMATQGTGFIRKEGESADSTQGSFSQSLDKHSEP